MGRDLVKALCVTLFLCFLIRAEGAAAAGKSVTIYTTIYPPYVVKEKPGKFSGISLVTARKLFNAAGYKVVYQVVPYKRAVRSFVQKRDGIMMGMLEGIPDYKKYSITEVSYMVFPTTYFYNRIRHPEYASITRLSDTKGKTVSIMGGTAFYEKVITDAGGTLIRVTNEEQVLKMVQGGRVDFGHTGVLTGLDRIRRLPDHQMVRPFPFSVTAITSGLVFHEKDYAVRDDFLRTVRDFHRTGRLLQIYKDALKDLPLAKPEEAVPKEVVVRVNVPEPAP